MLLKKKKMEKIKIVLHAARWSYLTLSPGPDDKQPFPTLYEYIIDPETDEVSQKELSDLYVDFPRINDQYLGKPYKYTYCARFFEPDENVGLWKFNEIVKFDVSDISKTKRYSVGEGRFAGEPCFVPRKQPNSEDDGFILTFVYDDKQNTSELVVLDAITFSDPPIARIDIGTRVPYGLHGQFWTKEQLASIPPPNSKQKKQKKK